jgi:hypothetical protein
VALSLAGNAVWEDNAQASKALLKVSEPFMLVCLPHIAARGRAREM